MTFVDWAGAVKTIMVDKNGRTIDYLRISITDRCNLRCIYCMPEEGIEQITHSDILSFDEILRIVRCAAALGITKIKLTGGEPLVRKGCSRLVSMIKQIPGIDKVTLTTNGILLAKELPELMEAGLDAVNISLDTLDPALFQEVTRRDGLNTVLEGIRAAMQYPQLVVKVNCVPVIDKNENFAAIASIARDYPVHVRFIEMMPIGQGKQFPFLTEDDIVSALEEVYGAFTPVSERLGNGPSHYYQVDGFQGKIGFVSAMTHKFCHKCNRVRLTAEGYLKACLQYQTGADLRSLMRAGCTDEALTETIKEVIWNKPVSHNFLEEHTKQDEVRVMSQIGG